MKKVILLAFACVAVLFACQKDIVSSLAPTNQKLMTLEKAQNWFNTVEPKTVWTKAEKQEHYKPQWDKAVQLNGAIEVPVLLENKIITPSANLDNPKQAGAARLLVVSFDGINIYGAIIKYFPSEKFNGKIADINRDNFREKKFDGMIKLENFDFTDQKVVLIENGELTYFMAQSLASDGRATAKPRDYVVCYQSCQYTQISQMVNGSMLYYDQPPVCGGVWCVTRPTDWMGNFGGNNTDPNGQPVGQGSSGGGMNDLGAGILGGGIITPVQKLCAESLPVLETRQSINGGYLQTSGLINVNIELKKHPLQGGGTYPINFPYLIFEITRGNDPFPPPIPNANQKITDAFNQAMTDTQKDIMLFNAPPISTKEDAKNRFLSNLDIHLTGYFGPQSKAFVRDANPNALDIFSGSSPTIPLSSVQTKDTSIENAPCKK